MPPATGCSSRRSTPSRQKAQPGCPRCGTSDGWNPSPHAQQRFPLVTTLGLLKPHLPRSPRRVSGGAVVRPQGENSGWPLCQSQETFFTYSKEEGFVSFLPWMPERAPWQASPSQNADSLLTLDRKLETEWGMGSTLQAHGACAICTVDRAELSRSEPSLCPGPVPSPPQFLLQWLLSDSIVPCVLPCLPGTLGGHTSPGAGGWVY